MVCLLDPSDNDDDILRVNRSREKTYVFDHSFGPFATQVRSECEAECDNPTSIYLFKVKNGNPKTIFKICS